MHQAGDRRVFELLDADDTARRITAVHAVDEAVGSESLGIQGVAGQVDLTVDRLRQAFAHRRHLALHDRLWVAEFHEVATQLGRIAERHEVRLAQQVVDELGRGRVDEATAVLHPALGRGELDRFDVDHDRVLGVQAIDCCIASVHPLFEGFQFLLVALLDPLAAFDLCAALAAELRRVFPEGTDGQLFCLFAALGDDAAADRRPERLFGDVEARAVDEDARWNGTVFAWPSLRVEDVFGAQRVGRQTAAIRGGEPSGESVGSLPGAFADRTRFARLLGALDGTLGAAGRIESFAGQRADGAAEACPTGFRQQIRDASDHRWEP